MNPLVRHIVSGDAFFSGAVLIVLALLLRPHAPGRWDRFVLSLVLFVGLALTVLSATPLPWWYYGLAGSAAVIAFGIDRSVSRIRNQPQTDPSERPPDLAEDSVMHSLRRSVEARSRTRTAKAITASAAVVWIGGIAWELPYHIVPAARQWPAPTLFVIGDSVSAGMGSS